MKISIDIAHPAHVHYFRCFTKIMEKRGHKVLFTARDRWPVLDLLEFYKINYIVRGEKEKSKVKKTLYPIASILNIYKAAKKFKPDLFMDMGTVFASPVAKLLKKPYIAFDDTETAKKARKFLMPFTDYILTPDCFYVNLGKKHLKFQGYMELLYLKSKYYKSDNSIFKLLGMKKGEKYSILRFVAWEAYHDKDQSGFRFEDKFRLVEVLSKKLKVFISSEKELPVELREYQINISPERMHDVLAYTELYIGEGATMASECAMLGTPAIYVNSITAGTLEDQEKYGLIYSFRNSEGVLEKALELLKIQNLKQIHQKRRQKMLAEKIDVTAFIVWFVENYPESVQIMKKNPIEIQKQFHGANPEYQLRFK